MMRMVYSKVNCLSDGSKKISVIHESSYEPEEAECTSSA